MISTRKIPSFGQVSLTCSRQVVGERENAICMYTSTKRAAIALINMMNSMKRRTGRGKVLAYTKAALKKSV